MKNDGIIRDPPVYPNRKYLPHGIPNWVSGDSIFFITVTCVERGRNQLCNPSVAEIVLESILHRQRSGHWWPHLCLLMPDHLHMLLSFAPEQDMRSLVAKWKEWTAKKSGVHWQSDFFDHRLRRDESFEEKAAYIRMNPVRKKLVGRAEDWKYVWGDETFGDFRG